MNNKGYGWLGIFVFIGIGILGLLLIGAIITSNVIYDGNDSDYSIQIPLKVSGLSLINLDNVNNAESYKEFADNTNNLIRILNEQSDWFNIPEIGDDYSKVSQFITEYSPLIKNYNEVVYTARGFEANKTDKNLQDFYIASSRFGFETITIMGGVFYAPSFDTVGSIYRASGLQTLAFKCSTCVSIALQEVHWTIRTALVETSSLTAKAILEINPKDLDKINMDSIRNEANKIINSEKSKNLQEKGKDVLDDSVNKTKEILGGIKNWTDNYLH